MIDDQRGSLRVLVFSASLRAASLNTRLARLAVSTIERFGASVDHASMREFDARSYDGDVEADEGMPGGGRRFASGWS
jgi:NAD(P)H-dependent FMN reductase